MFLPPFYYTLLSFKPSYRIMEMTSQSNTSSAAAAPARPVPNTKAFAVSMLAIFGLAVFAADYINLRSSVSHHLRVDDPVIAVNGDILRSSGVNGDLKVPDEATQDAVEAAIPRPIMTTFFEPVEGGCCGMTQQGHENLVASWKRAWEGHGWETRIFSEKEALKHPSFELLQQKLIEANVSEYDRRCFWRWLAMALDDNPLGGWMSDYDLFPLTLTGYKGLELMSKPGFKTYGGQVPALIHADQKSWEHIVQMMIENLYPDMNIDFISDMMLLLYLHQNYTEEDMGVTTWEFDLWKKFPYKRVPGQEDPVIDCNLVRDYLAAHLSHRGAQEAQEVTHTYPKIQEALKEGEYAEFRAQAADVMMRDMAQCIEPSIQ
jgi:hypothetical protein